MDTDHQEDVPNLIPSNDFQLNVFLKKIADEITREELKTLKFFCSGRGGFGKAIREEIEDAFDFFCHLKEMRLLSCNNLAPLQAMIWHLGRKDLYLKFVDFCERLGNTLHFYVPSDTPVNGYRHVNFHIRGMDCFKKDKISEVRNKLSELLCCPVENVIMEGVEPTDSMFITFMIPEWCIEILLTLKDEAKARLNAIGVDRFRVADSFVVCEDSKREDDISGMDKDEVVTKIISENNKLEKDLEHYQMLYHNCKKELERIKPMYNEAKSDLEAFEDEIKCLQDYILSLRYCTEMINEENSELRRILQSQNDASNEKPVISKRLPVTQISQEDRDHLETMSSDLQATIIELLHTNDACDITSKIMSRVYLDRHDSRELKKHVSDLVDGEVFEEVYKYVQLIKTIVDAMEKLTEIETDVKD